MTALALCLGLATFAVYLNYSAALGAFIMGSILAEIPILAKRIRHLMLPLRDVFAAFFFISVGMLINLEMFWQDLPIILAGSLAFSVLIILISFLSVFLTGAGLKVAVRASFSLVPIGEFSFVIMNLGLHSHVVDQQWFQIVVGISTITTFITPYLIRYSGVAARFLNAHLPKSLITACNFYTDKIHELQTQSAQIKTGYRAVIMRMLLDSAIITVIFLCGRSSLPAPIKHWFSLHRPVFWLTLMMASLPFIRDAIQSYQLVNKAYRVTCLLTCATIMLLELWMLSFGVLDGWHVSLFATLSLLFIVIVARRQLSIAYGWLGHKLNLWIAKQHYENHYDVLALLDTPLVSLVVNREDSPLLEQSLKELHVRQQYGINITTIRREGRVLLPPRGRDTLQLHDELILSGQEQDVIKFRELLEKPASFDENGELAEASPNSNFRLDSFRIEPNSVYIGKTVRNFNILERQQRIIMALERNGVRFFNPSPDLLLQETDLLLTLETRPHKS